MSTTGLWYGYRVGRPRLYPRLGFQVAKLYGIECEYEAPGGSFTIIERQLGLVEGDFGKIKYHSAFEHLVA
jgi:predicted N-acetyltransferase YhbS